MSKFDWLPGIAVVVILLLSVWSGLKIGYQQGYGDGGNDATAYEQGGAFSGGPPLEAIKSNDQANRNEWRDEEDLRAQRNMANWAAWMFCAAVATVIVTGLGVIYVAQTLDATRDAVRATNRATDETREIGKKQVRAYFSSPGGTYNIYLPDRMFVAKITLKNVGQSSARDITAHSELRIRRFWDEAAGYASPSEIESRFHGLASGQDHEIALAWFNVPQANLDAFAALDATISIKVFCEYWDVFEEKRHEKFAFVCELGNCWQAGNVKPT